MGPKRLGGTPMTARNVRFDVVTDVSADEDDIEAIRALLEQHGLAPSVEARLEEDERESVAADVTRHDPPARSKNYNHTISPWAVLLHSDINQLASDLGPSQLRDVVEELRRLRGEQEGTSAADGLMMLVDIETGIRLVLEFQLPMDAYEDLPALRFPVFQADPLRFHRQSGQDGRWRQPH